MSLIGNRHRAALGPDGRDGGERGAAGRVGMATGIFNTVRVSADSVAIAVISALLAALIRPGRARPAGRRRPGTAAGRQPRGAGPVGRGRRAAARRPWPAAPGYDAAFGQVLYALAGFALLLALLVHALLARPRRRRWHGCGPRRTERPSRGGRRAHAWTGGGLRQINPSPRRHTLLFALQEYMPPELCRTRHLHQPRSATWYATFYTKARADDALGPVFEAQVHGGTSLSTLSGLLVGGAAGHPALHRHLHAQRTAMPNLEAPLLVRRWQRCGAKPGGAAEPRWPTRPAKWPSAWRAAVVRLPARRTSEPSADRGCVGIASPGSLDLACPRAQAER